MRNLKLRAWHTEYKCMVYFAVPHHENIVVKDGKIYLITIPEFIGNKPIDALFRNARPTLIPIDDTDLIFMRYLGDDCRDKNGRELYEGDLIRLVGNYDLEHRKYIYRIIYKEGHFWADDNGEYDCVLPYWNDDVIKIGNLYEDE